MENKYTNGERALIVLGVLLGKGHGEIHRMMDEDQRQVSKRIWMMDRVRRGMDRIAFDPMGEYDYKKCRVWLGTASPQVVGIRQAEDWCGEERSSEWFLVRKVLENTWQHVNDAGMGVSCG